VGLLNDDLLVRIEPLVVDAARNSVPYMIERVDGQAFPFTLGIAERDLPKWYKTQHARCGEHRLRRLVPGNPGYPVYVNEEIDDVVESETTL
jgi:hypothetical protein